MTDCTLKLYPKMNAQKKSSRLLTVKTNQHYLTHSNNCKTKDKKLCIAYNVNC